jgi:DNA-binding PadR family transcriptional regulator
LDPQPHLPLKPRDHHILFARSRGILHGYGLVKALEEQSDGLLRLDPTSLYRRLKSLLQDGLVSEAEAPREVPADDPRRRYYELTEPGLQVLKADLKRMRALLIRAEAVNLVEAP